MRLAVLLLSLVVAGPDTAPESPEVEARKGRRARLAKHLGRGYAVVFGQPLTDVLQPLQEGHFHYLTGVEDPDATLLVAGSRARALKFKTRAGDAKLKEVVFLRAANPRFQQFYGVQYQPGTAATRQLGVEATRPTPRGGKGLGELLAKTLPKRAVLHVPAYGGQDHAPVRELRRAMVDVLKQARTDVKIIDLHPFLRDQRAVKDALEIAALRKAIAITLAAFRDVTPLIRPEGTESQLDGALLNGVRKRGGEPAYSFVVATGPHSAIPHYFRNESGLRAGQLLVIDAGASYKRYAADITRTFPVSGTFTQRQREVYEVVLKAQLAAIAAVKPGVTLGAVDKAARKIISNAGLGAYFIHATCHHVGLDVHDPGPSKLAPGMTITVEPGVYIAKEALGIRIEDLVLVTADGHEVLSPDFPKAPDAIEALLK